MTDTHTHTHTHTRTHTHTHTHIHTHTHTHTQEKHSAQNYNLSCIVVLPQHMRKGHGRMLIDFSYLLTRKEQKCGSPERPLSDLGLVSYRSYWKDVILTYILQHESNQSNISIKGERGLMDGGNG